MSQAENLTVRYLTDLWSLRDHRLDSFPLMSGPGPTLALCCAYLLTVTVIGPRFMRNREPFELRGVLIVYNLFQVVFSAVLVAGGLIGGWAGDYSFTCQPVDYSNSPKASLMAKVVYLYFVAKFTEFLDTIFFVLRKKFNQVSFLHVSHHVLMPIYSWPATRYIPGGHGSLGGVLNSLVHVFMYGYYLMAAVGGEHYKKARAWKKSLTWMQLTQFCVIFAHNLQLLVRKEECDYPKSQAVVTISLMVFFFVMFAHFYIKAYLGGKTAAATAESVSTTTKDRNSNEVSKKER